MDDYVGDITPHAKIQRNASVEAFWHMGEISLLRGFSVFPFL